MSEPTYEFVRGVGWVPQNNCGRVITDKGGNHILVLDRKPNIGECFLVYGVTERDWWDADTKQFVFDGVIEFMKTSDINELNALKEGETVTYGSDMSCTLIPVTL